MKQHRLALLAFLAVSSTLLTVLPACGAEPKTDDSANIPTEAVGEESAAETDAPAKEIPPEYRDAIGEQDFGGATINFLLYGDGTNQTWSETDVICEGENGEIINDGIYARNLALEERLNIHIAGKYDNDAHSTLPSLVSAGDDTFNAAFLGIWSVGSFAQKGMLLDFAEMPGIDLSKLYWDQAMIRDLSVGGKVYFMTGDISTIDNAVTWIMMFNKPMLASYDLESPYEIVRSGKWTVDKLIEMSKNVTIDLDGDGKFTEKDSYGFATTRDTIEGLFYSLGLNFVSKDENDLPVFTIDVEKGADVMRKIDEIVNRDNRTMLAERFGGWQDTRIAFLENRALFYGEVMNHVTNLRDMDTDFGIMPMPKYDENQKSYYTFINRAGSCLVVPMTEYGRLDVTGPVLEAMAAESYRHLTPAYYEIALKTKYARDDESSEMLDILLQNRVYDLSSIYGWGDLINTFKNQVMDGKTDFASLIAKKEKMVNSAINKFINTIMS